MRRCAALVLALCACAPAPLPPSDAAPDSMTADAPDDRAEPADVPELDAAPDAPTADVPSSPDVLEPRDVVDAARPDAPSDTGVTPPPDINARHDAMELRVLMRRTCGSGMTSGCDRVQSDAFEASCSVRGTRFGLSFLPVARVGTVRGDEVFASIDPPSTAIGISLSTGQVAQGTEALLTPGLEWVDRTGQRRQNFYVRARLAPNTMLGVRGISGVAGQTVLADYADFYALACPKGP